MAFKLGREQRNFKNSENVNMSRKNSSMNYKGSPLVFEKLEDGTLAEANMDGSISIDPSVNIDTAKGGKILRHEKQHIDDIQSGRAAYGDEWVMWENNIYFRKTVNGMDVIDGPNGRWPEGHPNHPWEQAAIEAEKLKKQ